jgi:hypothetical protein
MFDDNRIGHVVGEAGADGGSSAAERQESRRSFSDSVPFPFAGQFRSRLGGWLPLIRCGSPSFRLTFMQLFELSVYSKLLIRLVSYE